MKSEEVLSQFEETGALLSGHFRLSSGLHSDRYLQCAKVLQWPDRAALLGAALGDLLEELRPDLVVSPAMGGLIIGHEVGRRLGRRAIFTERADGAFVFRRGFALEAGEKVVVIEDVVTTGKSTREVLEVVRTAGGEVVGCGAIVDRRGADETGARVLDGIPFRSLVPLAVPAWPSEECPYCRMGQVAESPGSRYAAAGRPGAR